MTETSFEAIAKQTLLSTPIEATIKHVGLMNWTAVVKAGPTYIGSYQAFRKKTLLKKIEFAVQGWFNALNNY